MSSPCSRLKRTEEAMRVTPPAPASTPESTSGKLLVPPSISKYVTNKKHPHSR